MFKLNPQKRVPRETGESNEQDEKLDERNYETDFRNSHRDFKELMALGKEYISPPFPLNLELNDPATKLIQHYSHKWIIELMAASDVGRGTDPERLDEYTLLNLKGHILDRSLFSTNAVRYHLHEGFQKVHTLMKELQVSKKNNIDFGVGGGFSQVSLGFNAVSNREEEYKGKDIIGITDQGYRWATTASHLKHECLNKYLHEDFKDKVSELEDHLNSLLSTQNTIDRDKLTESLLTTFMEAYGSHLILKCSHGYRVVERVQKTVEDKKDLENFKVGLHLAVLDFIDMGAKYQKNTSTASTQDHSFEGMKSVGSPICSKNVLCGKIDSKQWEHICTRSGDGGVISHDETMPIADLVKEEYPRTAELLRFWTTVRVRDLQQGWNKPMFACSYMLQFIQAKKQCVSRQSCVPIRESGVHVLVDGCQSNDYAFHQHQQKTPSMFFVTTVLSSNVQKIRITSPNEYTHLNNILEEVHIFFRRLEVDGKGGSAKFFPLIFKNINKATVDLSFENCEITLLEEGLDFGTVQEKVMPVALARSMALGWSDDETNWLGETNICCKSSK